MTANKTAHEIVSEALNAALQHFLYEASKDASSPCNTRQKRHELNTRLAVKYEQALALLETTHAVVPREPTGKMLDNITDERGTVRILEFTRVEERGLPHLMSKTIYRAMIAAATEGEKK